MRKLSTPAVLVALALLLPAGCGPLHLYEGGQRDDHEVALIRQEINTYGLPLDEATVEILAVDGRPVDPGASEFAVLPGEHEMDLRAYIRVGATNYGWRHGTLRFRASAGRTYGFVPILFTKGVHVPSAIALVDQQTGETLADTVPTAEVAISADLDFQGRPWNIADWGRDSTRATATWLPDGQTLEHWDERVEAQTWVPDPGEAFGPEEALARHVDLLTGGWDNRRPPATHSETPRADGTRLLEWHAEAGPMGPAEHGVMLLRVQEGRVHVLTYTARSAEMLSENQGRWIAVFTAAPLTLPKW